MGMGGGNASRTMIGSLRKTPLVLLFLFAVLLLVGIACDEPSRVLEQARAICLPCIGID
jgi:hypothetical protein